MFDRDGQRIDGRTIRSCIERGWAEPWIRNPVKPGWLVCRLTEQGRDALDVGFLPPEHKNIPE